MRRRIGAAKYAACLMMAYAFLAQPDLQAQRRPATLDVTIGVTTAQTNRLYSAKSGAVLIATFVAAHQSSRILAVSAGLGNGGFPNNDCLLVPGGDGSCAPPFPATAHVAVAEGFEFGSRYLTARTTLGPAFYLSTTHGQSSGVGGQLTIDLAAGLRYLKAVASGRYTVIRRKGETDRMPGVDIGIRL